MTALLETEAPVRYDLDDFALFCSTLRVENGEPMELEAFQRTILEAYFGGVTETCVIIGKKNGKSSLFAALALYHLERTDQAECIIAASSREQARILFKQAARLIRNSKLEVTKTNPKGRFVVKSGYGMVWLKGGSRDDAVIKVISADANTGDGHIPTLALVDELHRHPNGELYGVLADGLGPRHGQIITLSTAGATTESALGTLRKRAQMMPGFSRDEATKHSVVESPDFVMHEWSLDPSDDVEDMAVVKLANPASWHTEATLSARRHSPTMTDSRWLRFACGIWTTGEEPWIAPALWDSLPLTQEIPDGSTVCVGVRVGQGHQTAAVAWVSEVDGVYQTGYEMMSGFSRLTAVEDKVREVAERFDVRFCAYVSKTFDRSAEILAEEGLNMLAYPVGSKTMDMAETFLKLIGEARIAHEGPGDLRQSVLAGQSKQIESGWKFVDRSVGVPTDALLALAAAVHVSETQQPIEPMFAWT